MATILITGANGEIGHSLINHHLKTDSDTKIIALDLKHNEQDLAASKSDPRSQRVTHVQGDILDQAVIADLSSRYEFDTIFHLAALLSTGGEKNPLRAHQVNVEGSFNLLNLAREQSERRKQSVKFIFPSTIAIYGIPSQEEKEKVRSVKESEFLFPITMYGSNKLYVENLGRYFSNYFRFLEDNSPDTRIDFRAVRLPGVVSATTVPTGGTSDYGPEMLHAAAQGKAYQCFVTPEARLPFMVMPDAVLALTSLAAAPRKGLTQQVYNVTSFSLSAEEIRREVLKYFPGATIGYQTHPKRNAIVASWPGNTDDSAARADWGWKPAYDKETAFRDYLVPAITERYHPTSEGKISANGH
jgi:threonine 3-dehydrogenase